MRRFLCAWGMPIFLACILLAGFAVAAIPESVFTVAEPQKSLIIDAGHGEPDGGSVGSDGTTENSINLDIANRLYDLALMFCIPTERTRSTESGIWDAECESIREKKNSDLKNRVAFVNARPGAVLISIHQNAYAGYVRGAQVYAREDMASDLLAERITGALELRGNIPTRAATRLPNGLYLFRNTSCTAVIVECGYMTDATDLGLLRKPEYREWLAVAILQGYISACGEM